MGWSVWMLTGAAPRLGPAGVGRLGAEWGKGFALLPTRSHRNPGQGPSRFAPVPAESCRCSGGPAAIPLAPLQRVLGKG